MSEHHRALIFLLVIGLVLGPLVGGLAPSQLPGAHRLRRGLWFAFTTAAFGLGQFWLFAVSAFVLLLWSRSREQNAPALFLALLFAAPPVEHDVPGFGVVNYFFSLSLPRLLALTLLLPVFVQLARRPRASAGLARAADLFFLGYLAVQLALLAREASVTSALRTVFYLFLDMVLPYYVFSRAFDNLDKVRDAVAALVVAGGVLAGVAVFEVARHWLLYSALTHAWGSADQLLYLPRGGMLRGMGSTGHAIALGFVLAVCLLLYLPMHARLAAGWRRMALLLVLAAGLVAALSRGPWLGFAAGFVLYLLLGPRPARSLVLSAAGAAAGIAVVAMLPMGQLLLGLIPFVGNVESGNIVYRQRLMEAASALIREHPFLGSGDYVERLAAMGMVQGQGIVDIVNTYVQVALRSGLAGLALFCGLLGVTLLAAWRASRLGDRDQRNADADLGRSLVAAHFAVIITIGTVSSIVVIPWLYWCLAGLLVSYARLRFAEVREARLAISRASTTKKYRSLA